MILLIDTDDILGKFGWDHRLAISKADDMVEAQNLCQEHGIPYSWHFTKWPHIDITAEDREKLTGKVKAYRVPIDIAELLAIMEEWEK
jgi:hypothetical protein